MISFRVAVQEEPFFGLGVPSNHHLIDVDFGSGFGGDCGSQFFGRAHLPSNHHTRGPLNFPFIVKPCLTAILNTSLNDSIYSLIYYNVIIFLYISIIKGSWEAILPSYE